MKLNFNARQNVQKTILAFALGIALLAGILGLQPATKQDVAEVTKMEQTEEVARLELPFDIVPLSANFWSG